MSQSLPQRIKELVCAGFSGIWVDTQEVADAVETIRRTAADKDWGCECWDLDCQLYVHGQKAPGPVQALRWLDSSEGRAKHPQPQLLVLVNFHKYITNPEVMQVLSNRVHAGKKIGQHVLIVSPVMQMVPEIEKLFTLVHHELPDREQLTTIANELFTGDNESLKPAAEHIAAAVEAAAGMTRAEAENAFSLSMVRNRTLSPDVIWTLKSQVMEKAGTLSLYRGDASFDALGGLSNLKEFCLRAMRRQGEADPKLRPKGVMLLSPPGCGKSQFAKALGNEVGRPTVMLDFGSLMGKFVGESEGNMRRALGMIDAMSPCILFVDEIEKALSGVSSSSQTDSGVTARLFGTLLTWLNDHKSDVFFIGTCNKIEQLPPEFTRAGRFDGVFFVDLPDAEARDYIWNLYLDKFGLDKDQKRPADANWTGAEIESCCRLARLLDVSLADAAQNVVPISVTAAESIESLRGWATGRCLSANSRGLYHRNASGDKPQAAARRRTMPSAN